MASLAGWQSLRFHGSAVSRALSTNLAAANRAVAEQTDTNLSYLHTGFQSPDESPLFPFQTWHCANSSLTRNVTFSPEPFFLEVCQPSPLTFLSRSPLTTSGVGGLTGYLNLKPNNTRCILRHPLQIVFFRCVVRVDDYFPSRSCLRAEEPGYYRSRLCTPVTHFHPLI